MPTAYIALGANLPSAAGPPDATLAAAAAQLAASGRIVARSSLYSTKPVGLADQPRFFNAVVALETRLAPYPLLESLFDLEIMFDRDRSNAIPSGPRTLDLDLVLYGDFVLSESGLEVPHRRFSERAFVLVPLGEIAPTLRDPRSGRSIAELLQALPPEIKLDVVPTENAHWSANPGVRG